MKVGIVGVGFMGTTHAAGWAETDVEIVGFGAETRVEALPLVTLYDAKYFPDLDALLSEVDVVDICTPTHLHYEMVLRAAQAGKNVICEKPLALSVAQAQEMIRVCREAHVCLLVAHVVRYFPQYALARQAVEAGQIGQPGVLRLTRGSYRPKKPLGNWFLDEKKSGGILLDLMIHDFDYARWIAGEVESVYAKKISTGHPEAPVDYGMAILKHRGGALSHIAGAWAYPPPTFRTHLEIAGDGGLIEFDSESSAPILNLIQKPSSAENAPDVGLPSSPVAESPYTSQIKEFYQVLTRGAQARVSAEDGLAAVQIALAAVESATSGKAVTLEPLPEVQS
jgi:predicted dehydrogenase